MDTWRDMSQVFKIINRVKNQMFGTKYLSFLLVSNLGEKGGEREKSKISLGDSRSSVGRNPSSQKLKFISSMRSMRTYQEQGFSSKIKMRRFGEIKCFGLRKYS